MKLRALPALAAALLLQMPLYASAADTAPGGPVTAGSVLQVAGALVVVLALLVGTAWLIKRLNMLPRTGAGALRVVGGVAVGARERVVVIEVKDTWLVVGVANASVSALHTMPRPAEALAERTGVSATPGSSGFAQRLKRALERRDA